MDMWRVGGAETEVQIRWCYGGGAPEASKELLGLFYEQEVLLHRLLAFPLHVVWGAVILLFFLTRSVLLRAPLLNLDR
jgi:hypothetical protein